ncbi:hypothetical protein [Clostridium sp. FP1]|uniref:hypothetical protein n=1 Tax=Clostridium sp. FP1 TaxID=2724076 RepID=UPI0013E96FA3|nr:hypothetical protein [Clostridium sp. FP1]MBZ9635536.1 hypothetical protein [Clostridium sp. FP1]
MIDLDKLKSGQGSIEEVEGYIEVLKQEIYAYSDSKMMMRIPVGRLMGICKLYKLDINNYVSVAFIERSLEDRADPKYIQDMNEKRYYLYTNSINGSDCFSETLRELKEKDLDYIIGKAFDKYGDELIDCIGIYIKDWKH